MSREILPFFLYFFLFLRVYIWEHEVGVGGSDTWSSRDPSAIRVPQHHMKESRISISFLQSKAKDKLFYKTNQIFQISKQIQSVKKYKKVRTKQSNVFYCYHLKFIFFTFISFSTYLFFIILLVLSLSYVCLFVCLL